VTEQTGSSDGRSAALAAVAGNQIGVFAWALAAGAGLTALLQANRLLFDAPALTVGCRRAAPHWRRSARPWCRFAANPKAAVFAFSFFPQFCPGRFGVRHSQRPDL